MKTYKLAYQNDKGETKEVRTTELATPRWSNKELAQAFCDGVNAARRARSANDRVVYIVVEE